MNSSSAANSQAIVRRIHGGLRNPADLRAMNLELHVANHFVSRGFEIEWPEMNKMGTFDLFVPAIGDNGLEIECKSVSNDKGRKIHRRDALDFFHLLRSEIEVASKSITAALSVVLTIPGRLPAPLAEKRGLAKKVKHSLLRGASQQFEDGSSIRISEFSPADFAAIKTQGKRAVTREFVDRVTSTVNREAMIIGNPQHGTIVMVIQSAEDDELLTSVFDTIADSARKQLSGRRPGIFFVGFTDVTSEQMISLAEHDYDPLNDATALRKMVSKFLANPERDHVIGVSFLSQSQLEEATANIVSSKGSAYYFRRRESRFWHDDFAGLVRDT